MLWMPKYFRAIACSLFDTCSCTACATQYPLCTYNVGLVGGLLTEFPSRSSSSASGIAISIFTGYWLPLLSTCWLMMWILFSGSLRLFLDNVEYEYSRRWSYICWCYCSDSVEVFFCEGLCGIFLLYENGPAQVRKWLWTKDAMGVRDNVAKSARIT